MGTGEADLFLTGLWLIPALLLVTLAGVYLLVRQWSQRSQEELKALGAEVRRLEERYRAMLQTVGMHTVEDPEPYGSRAAALLEQLEALEQSILDLQRQRIALQEETTRLTFNRWQVLFSAPYYWLQLRRQIGEGQDMLAEIEGALEAIRDYEKDLSRISWQVAQLARAARRDLARARGLYDQLHAHGVHGDSMEAALREQMETQADMARIPAYFFEGDEGQVLEQADKERTAEVHELLEGARPRIERLLAQASAWEQSYAGAKERVARMGEAIEAVAPALKDVPPAIQAGPSRERFTGLQTIARSLSDTLGRLEVENMGMVAEEAGRVAESARQMDADLKRAREQLGALETVLAEMSAGLKALSMQVASLRTRTDYPVMWNVSVDTLTALNRELNAIGPAAKPREPEQVGRDLARGARLNARYRELARHCQQIEEAHGEWLRLLDGPELGQVGAWLEATRELIGQVADYAPENWPRSDAVSELPGDVASLAAEVGRLVPQKRETPIPEGELLGRLENTRQLVERLQKLGKRVGNVRQRLSDLKETERLSAGNLHTARAALTQIQYIINSNAFLAEVAAQEAKRLDDETLALLEELEGARKGVVEKTARGVNTLLAKMEGSSNRWLDQLTGDLREVVDDLSKTLTALDTVAGLDEPAVAEARRLLSASGKFSLDDRRAKSGFPLEVLASEFNRRSEYWQSCAAAAAALAEVEEYVMASFEEATYYRQQAQDLLAETSTWLRQTRDWPPTSISLDEERRELQRLDDQWKSLKDRRLKALALVQQLGNFSAKYQSLGGKVSQAAERADQEQAQVEELEVELSELAQIWEDHRHDYRDYPQVDDDIRGMLETTDHELGTIRRQYKQKTKNYEQVIRALKDLNKRLKYYQVALDGDNALDASGRVIRRR